MRTSTEREIQSEGRLLYALLDAADEAGLLAATTAASWRETKTRILCGTPYEIEALICHRLLSELVQQGDLSGTWIEARWRTIVARIDSN
ncbi:MAG: hypothetical protein WCQ89_22250 [Verrucomicrobiota bacterium]